MRPAVLASVLLASTALAGIAHAADAADAAALEEVVVTGEKGFGATAVQAGGFRNARVIDTPLTVNVISREVLEAQAAEGLYEGLRNTAGVTRSQLSGGTYDNIAIRGILVENRGNYRLNGSLPVINLIEQPLEDKARVEVLKGASALHYGFVPPSGIINMTAKRAGDEPVTEVTLRGDNHGTAIGALDVGRRLADGKVGMRVNLAGGDVATGVDHVKGDRLLAAVALDLDLTERLSFDLDYEHIEKDIAEPAAIALLPAVAGRITLPAVPDPETNLAGSWQRYDAKADNLLARMDFRLSDDWALKVEAGKAATDRDRAFSQFQAYNLTTGEGTLRISQVLGQKYRNENARVELTGRIVTGPVTHELTFGWTGNERRQNGRAGPSTNVAQNLYAPRTIAPLATPTALTSNPSKIVDKGAYALDRATFGPVQFIAGLRWSDYESNSTIGGRPVTYAAKEVSPTVAVIYKPVDWASLYATYVEGLEEGGVAPANNANAFEVLPPGKSEQWEVGAKAEFARGVVASIAYFEIVRPSAFTNAQNTFVQDGETEYRGAEMMAAGELTSDLSLVASALWLDAEQTKASTANVVGKRPENTPEWTASLFLDWKVPAIEGLGLNGGVFYTGERAVNPANQAFIGDYLTVALGARYEREIAGRQTRFQVNIENAMDEAYWNTAGNGLIGVGAPRTVKFQVTSAL